MTVADAERTLQFTQRFINELLHERLRENAQGMRRVKRYLLPHDGTNANHIDKPLAG